MITLEVLGIRLADGDDAPVLLLGERGGSRVLPIWIASVDAAAIALVLDGNDTLKRPLTHDLVATLVRRLVGEGVSGTARITSMSDGVFHAELTAPGFLLELRPSDGVATALRLGWSIECPEALMAAVGVEGEESGDDEVERFREFLDSVNADDFEGESGSSGG